MRIGIDSDLSRRIALEAWRAQVEAAHTSMQRLSTGLRVNSAVDDAAGLAIAEGMRAQILGARQAQQNVQDGVNLLRVADGALSESMGLLQRMRVIAVQGATGTYDDGQRAALQDLLLRTVEALDGIAHQTQYNTMRLLDGSRSSWSFQVGAGSGDAVHVSIAGSTASHLGLAQVTAPAATAPAAAGAPAPPIVSYTLSSSGAATTVSAWTGAPTGGTFFVQESVVYAGADAGGVVVGSYAKSSRQVTFMSGAGGGTITVDGLLWQGNNPANRHGTFTLTRVETSAPEAGPAAGPAASPTATTTTAVSVLTAEGAQEAIGRIDAAIALLTDRRTSVGVAENGLMSLLGFLDVHQLNLTAAESRIRDADIAAESAKLMRLQAASDASAQALSQATRAQFDAVNLLLAGAIAPATAAAGAASVTTSGTTGGGTAGAGAAGSSGGPRREPAVAPVSATPSSTGVASR